MDPAMTLDEALTLLAADPAAPLDLAEVALLLARDEYPDVDVEAYLSELAGMAHEARRYLRGDLRTRVRGLCRYLFHEMGFRGNTQTYYDPRNSYFNQVLDRRLGIPITLTAVAMSVGSRAGLEIAGVGLPGHFLARASDSGEEVLFDPFHGGRERTEEECAALVEQATGQAIPLGPEHFAAVSLGVMVQRMLNNLKAIYLRDEDFPRAVRILERLTQLAPGDLSQQRDLGAALLRVGRAGPAIEHLEAYLQGAASAPDATMVQRLLAQARSEVARWN
jgi:regulator of sirC expression with transglutaminase-like and TPR domain